MLMRMDITLCRKWSVGIGVGIFIMCRGWRINLMGMDITLCRKWSVGIGVGMFGLYFGYVCV